MWEVILSHIVSAGFPSYFSSHHFNWYDHESLISFSDWYTYTHYTSWGRGPKFVHGLWCVCLIHLQCRWRWMAVGCCLVHCHSTLLLMVLGQQIWKWQVLMNVPQLEKSFSASPFLLTILRRVKSSSSISPSTMTGDVLAAMTLKDLAFFLCWC